MGEEKKTKHGKRNALAALYFIVIIALVIIIYVLPKVSDAFTPTVILEYGKMQVTDDVTCYIIRNEQVITASGTGTTTYYVDEGVKSRKGSRIADINGTGYFCPATGVVSYYCDGLESQYSPDTMETLDLLPIPTEEELENDPDAYAFPEPENMHRTAVNAGEPLYKLVNNDIWYAACRVESASIVKYQKGAKISIVLPLDTVQGTVEKIVDKGDYWMVILKFNRYYEDMPKLRRLEATVITSDNSGLIVPNESLTQEEGVTGVYVKDISGNYNFTRVKVITTDGEFSLLESTSFNEKQEDGTTVKVSTVDIYDEIQRKPQSKPRTETSTGDSDSAE
ncbi:MAG: hypothetical protein IJ486_01425 [Firmicutes bacterium]|nr:hypothetical protein [Bacillota bacterium]